MTNPKDDVKTLFNEEIDETLFKSLDFHAGLKKEVRKKIRKSDKKSQFYSIFNRIGKYRVFTYSALAAAIYLVFLSTMLFQESDSNENQPNPMQESNFSTFQSEGNESILPTPFKEEIWELNSIEEARDLYGVDLMLPTYVPEDFQLERIHVLNGTKEQVNKLILSFTSIEESYSVMVERTNVQNKPLGTELVDIKGLEGYLKRETPEQLVVELNWFINDSQYTINGIISSAEALKIARSFD
ncbi:DUF4367 domain-containing protein [Neobacillus sp. FSL H8-0543]|uniref:DUF4367 domain-containing protein n=1 Tax=Neobacillus sp. FSL H8-0543 TaxID=2954672 RepID=UPI0031596055